MAQIVFSILLDSAKQQYGFRYEKSSLILYSENLKHSSDGCTEKGQHFVVCTVDHRLKQNKIKGDPYFFECKTLDGDYVGGLKTVLDCMNVKIIDDSEFFLSLTVLNWSGRGHKKFVSSQRYYPGRHKLTNKNIHSYSTVFNKDII